MGKQKWRTKSGKPSSKTGERYLPEKVIKRLSSSEYAASTRKKEKLVELVVMLSIQKKLLD